MDTIAVLIVVLMALVAICIGVGLYIIFQMARIRWVVNNLKRLRMETVFDKLGDPDSVRFYFGNGSYLSSICLKVRLL